MHERLSGPNQTVRTKGPPGHIPLQAIRSISQPSTRSSTPSWPTSLSLCSSHHSPAREVSTPGSSQLFSNTSDPLSSLLAEDADRGADIDHQVKLALTDLLNSSDIRNDMDARMWVQNRLMSVERRLKARRKSHILNGERQLSP
jgi:hypothetical protein